MRNISEKAPQLPGVYAIKCIPNGRIYIGSSKNIEVRRKRHLSDLMARRHTSRHMQSSFDKYSADNFLFTVLYFSNIEVERLQQETRFISIISPSILFNSAPVAGTTLGYKHTPETRNLMSAQRTGKPLTNAQKIALSRSRHGKPKSRLHKQALSVAQTGKRHSDETIEKIRQRKLSVSEETRAKLRAARARQIFTDETRQKMSMAQKRRQRENHA